MFKKNDRVTYFGEEFTVIAVNGELVGITNGKRTYNVPANMLKKIEAKAEPKAEAPVKKAPAKKTAKK